MVIFHRLIEAREEEVRFREHRRRVDAARPSLHNADFVAGDVMALDDLGKEDTYNHE